MLSPVDTTSRKTECGSLKLERSMMTPRRPISFRNNRQGSECRTHGQCQSVGIEFLKRGSEKRTAAKMREVHPSPPVGGLSIAEGCRPTHLSRSAHYNVSSLPIIRTPRLSRP